MKFEQIYSSSRANLYTVTAANGRRLLLECGVSWTAILKALDYELDNIDGCLLTHEHLDHSKAVKEVMRAGIDVYSSAGTFEALGIKSTERRAIVIYPGKNSLYWNKKTGFIFVPYISNHDANEPFYFIIQHEGECLLFAPDASHIKQRFIDRFSIIAIECSYDIKILKHRVDTNDINEALAKRLLSSHASKQTTMNYLAEFCDLSKCKEIHLLHMSADNIDKQATKKEFEKRFFISTIIK